MTTVVATPIKCGLAIKLPTLSRQVFSAHYLATRLVAGVQRGLRVKNQLKYLEWFGVVTAIAYSLFVASNLGLEFLGFILLCLSAISIGTWAYLDGHRGIFVLQIFYTVAGLIGMVRWF